MTSSDKIPSRVDWTPHPLSPWLAIAATLLLLGFLEVRRQPTEPVSTDAPADVFSAKRAFEALGKILDADPSGRIEIHPTGSDAAERVRDRIADELTALGVPADAIAVQETVACRGSDRWSYVGCTPVRNLVATLPGPQDGPAVVLMSHYDSVGAGPGVSDDAVGVAAMLETVRALLAADPTGADRLHPIVVLVTDAEEVGLFGARGFVDRHPLALAGRIGAVVNLEARGTEGQSLLFQASDDDAWIVDAYRSVARRPATSSLYAEVYRRLPNDTDLSVFLDAGIVGINFAYAEGVQRYHTPRDDLAHLDRGSLQQHGDHLLAMARALTSDPRLGDPPAGRAVYTDIASFFVLAYPVSWALPLAVLALFGLQIPMIVAIWRRESRPVELSVAIGALLASTVAAIALAWLYGELVKWLGGSPRPGWAHPLPFRAGLWALVFLVPAGFRALLRRLGRRTPSLDPTARSMVLASWLCLALLAAVLAVIVPGVSLFATLPALVAAILGTLALRTRQHGAQASSRSASWFDAALLGTAVATAFFWLNIARGLEMGMGLHNGALVAAPLAICSWPFVAYFWAEGRTSRFLAPSLGAVVLVGFVGALVVAPYSETNPLGVNVVFLEDHSEGKVGGTAEATIWVDSGADVPPDEMIEAASLGPLPERAPDALRLGSAYPAPTDPAGLEPPRLEVLGVEEFDTGGRRVSFRLVGPAADFLRLHLPAEADVHRIAVAGYDFDLANKEIPGAHVLVCIAPDCDGVQFTVEVGGNDALTGELYAIRYGSVYGLPDAARRVAEARPTWAAPVHSGDRTAVRASVTLP